MGNVYDITEVRTERIVEEMRERVCETTRILLT